MELWYHMLFFYTELSPGFASALCHVKLTADSLAADGLSLTLKSPDGLTAFSRAFPFSAPSDTNLKLI